MYKTMQMLFLKHLHLFFHEEKPTVRQISEFVEKEREIKNPLFRQFIHVNLGILVEPYENILFCLF